MKIPFGLLLADGPLLLKHKPHSLAPHLLGYEAPSTTHAVLNEQGLICGLSSGTSISTSTFCLFSASLSLAPHGAQIKDRVLALVLQWLNLIKSAPHSKLEEHHQELQKMADARCDRRDKSDPLDFVPCAPKQARRSSMEEALPKPSSLGEFDSENFEFLNERLAPEHVLTTIRDPDHASDGINLSAYEMDWEVENGVKNNIAKVHDQKKLTKLKKL